MAVRLEGGWSGGGRVMRVKASKKKVSGREAGRDAVGFL